MTTTKWTPEDVRAFSKVMKEEGVSMIELPGLKLIRSPQADYYADLTKKSEEFQKKQAEAPVTDADILMNAYAGMGDVAHG